MIKTTDLNAIENAIMTHRSSGEKMKLSDLNANSRAFVAQIRGLNLKAGRQELLNREAEKANEISEKNLSALKKVVGFFGA